jgi:hypothetical protein
MKYTLRVMVEKVRVRRQRVITRAQLCRVRSVDVLSSADSARCVRESAVPGCVYREGGTSKTVI